jgi:exodeoxyribonuclease VII large subunit
MARLPFDPDHIDTPQPLPPARRERARQGGGPAPLTVSQLTRQIKGVLADHLPAPVRVVGEVSNFNDRRHWYLSLKDDEHVIDCVMFVSSARRCRFVPERGQQVVATGRVDFYGPQGRLQLYLDKLEPVGQGALEQRFRQLCEELRGLGYFDEDRKRALPAFPQHLAVITSASGAALQDVIRTTQQRWGGCQLYLIDTRVQGEGAAEEIARVLRSVSAAAKPLQIDAILLTRGGGSLEDLWAFNERVVADAVLECAVPVVAAIGHETDITIAELVADLRCSTPTQAAARLVPDARAEAQRLDHHANRLIASIRRRLDYDAERLRAAARHELFRRPASLIDRGRDRLNWAEARLCGAGRTRLDRERTRLAGWAWQIDRIDPARAWVQSARQLAGALRRCRRAMQQQVEISRSGLDAWERQLTAVGPQQVLARGYSYTTDASGKLIRSVKQVRPGQSVTTHVSDGRVHSVVSDDARATPVPRPAGDRAHPQRRTRRPSEDQGSLFSE